MLHTYNRQGFAALVVLSWLLLVACGLCGQARAAHPSDPMYDPTTVSVIELTLSSEAEEDLETEPEEYVPGTFSLATTSDGTPAGEQPPAEPPRNVEIRLKGSASFRPLTGKAAFKLKFKKADAFLGLRKMTLNNMVEDHSLIHETLAYKVFDAAGVPAPRTGYAFVRINGVDYGLYTNVETLDKVALEKRFGSFDEETQHLYEGEYEDDVHPGGALSFEVDEGDEGDLGDLEALIAAVNGAGSDWSTQVAAVADLEEMTRMWAVEKYVGHWDGYAGREGAFQPNNYYLYSDSSGRFQMLPWGTDDTWTQRIDFGGTAGLMFNKCMTDAACGSIYLQQLDALGPLIDSLDLGVSAEAAADLVRPWVEVDPRLEHPELFDQAVAGTLEFIADRPRELAAWLSPDGTEPGASGEPSIAPHPPRSRPRLRVNAVFSVGTALRSHLHLPGPGHVWQKVTFKTAKGRVRVCVARARVQQAGRLPLRCRFSAAARRHLRARWLMLSVLVRFTPIQGDAETIATKVLGRRLGAR